MPETEQPCVLITRPEPGAAETAARVASRGYRAIVSPMLTIQPRSLLNLPRIQAVLVTSGNAIPSLKLVDRETRLFAVGDATAARASQAGFTRVTSAAGDARALAALVARNLSPEAGSLVLASGAGQGLTLASDLRETGFRVLRRVAYAAEPAACLSEAARLALGQGRIRAVLFFSAETAKTFVRVLPFAPAVVSCVAALAISHQVAAALSGLPWQSVLVASHPNQDDLVALLP